MIEQYIYSRASQLNKWVKRAGFGIVAYTEALANHLNNKTLISLVDTYNHSNAHLTENSYRQYYFKQNVPNVGMVLGRTSRVEQDNTGVHLSHVYVLDEAESEQIVVDSERLVQLYFCEQSVNRPAGEEIDLQALTLEQFSNKDYFNQVFTQSEINLDYSFLDFSAQGMNKLGISEADFKILIRQLVANLISSSNEGQAVKNDSIYIVFEKNQDCDIWHYSSQLLLYIYSVLPHCLRRQLSYNICGDIFGEFNLRIVYDDEVDIRRMQAIASNSILEVKHQGLAYQTQFLVSKKKEDEQDLMIVKLLLKTLFTAGVHKADQISMAFQKYLESVDLKTQTSYDLLNTACCFFRGIANCQLADIYEKIDYICYLDNKNQFCNLNNSDQSLDIPTLIKKDIIAKADNDNSAMEYLYQKSNSIFLTETSVDYPLCKESIAEIVGDCFQALFNVADKNMEQFTLLIKNNMALATEYFSPYLFTDGQQIEHPVWDKKTFRLFFNQYVKAETHLELWQNLSTYQQIFQTEKVKNSTHLYKSDSVDVLKRVILKQLKINKGKEKLKILADYSQLSQYDFTCLDKSWPLYQLLLENYLETLATLNYTDYGSQELLTINTTVFDSLQERAEIKPNLAIKEIKLLQKVLQMVEQNSEQLLKYQCAGEFTKILSVVELNKKLAIIVGRDDHNFVKIVRSKKFFSLFYLSYQDYKQLGSKQFYQKFRECFCYDSKLDYNLYIEYLTFCLEEDICSNCRDTSDDYLASLVQQSGLDLSFTDNPKDAIKLYKELLKRVKKAELKQSQSEINVAIKNISKQKKSLSSLIFGGD